MIEHSSENYFKELIEKSAYMMLVIDAQGQLLHANKAFETIMQVDLTHTDHNMIWDYVDPYSKTLCAHQFMSATAGEQFDIELLFRKKNKDVFYGEGAFHCIFDPLRNTNVLIGVVKDKSAFADFDLAYQALERQLEENKNVYQLMHDVTLNFLSAEFSEVDSCIDKALKTFGELVYADRAFVMLYDIEAGLYSNSHEWTVEGIASKKDALQRKPIDWTSSWILKHMKGETIYVADIHALAKTDIIRKTLSAFGVKSMISVPFFYDGYLYGAVGFDSVKVNRTNADLEEAILKDLGELIVRMLRKANLLKL